MENNQSSDNILHRPLLCSTESSTDPSLGASVIIPDEVELLEQLQHGPQDQIATTMMSIGKQVRAAPASADLFLGDGIRQAIFEGLDNSNREINAWTCYAIHSLVFAKPEAATLFGTAALCQKVVNILQSAAVDEDLIIQASRVIRNLSVHERSRYQFAELGAHMVLVDQLQSIFDRDWQSVVEPMVALMSLASQSAVLRDLRERSSLHILRKCFDFYLDPDSLTYCIGLFYNLAFDAVLVEQLFSSFVCERIIAIMNMHDAHRDIQLYGINAIGKIAQGVLPDAEYYQSLHVDTVISRALLAFPNDKELKCAAQITTTVVTQRDIDSLSHTECCTIV